MDDSGPLDVVLEGILRHGYLRIGIQVGSLDGVNLSSIYMQIVEKLKGVSLYFLCGTGGCCPDEISASHIGLEAIIQIGRSCSSLPCILPVYRIFLPLVFDVTILLEYLNETRIMENMKRIVIFLEPEYYNSQFRFLVEGFGPFLIFSSEDDEVKDLEEDISILYVGDFEPIKILMRFPYNKTYAFSPKLMTGRILNRIDISILKRRYFSIERAREAKVFGILTTSPGLKNHLKTVEKCFEMIRSCGRKAKVLSMGQVDVSKLSNFLDLDAIVLVSCSETSIMDDREFLVPIITPFELMLILESKPLDGCWKYNISEFLEDTKTFSYDPERDPYYSLYSGKVVGGELSYSRLDLMAARMTEKEYRGLDVDFLDDSSGPAICGKAGVPRSYDASLLDR